MLRVNYLKCYTARIEIIQKRPHGITKTTNFLDYIAHLAYLMSLQMLRNTTPNNLAYL